MIKNFYNTLSFAFYPPFVVGFFILVGMLIFLSGCASDNSANNTSSQTRQSSQSSIAVYQKITPKEAAEMMDDEDVIVLDVRTVSEYQEGHIEGAVLLPVDRIAKEALTVLPQKDRTILIYCRSGNRSATAARELIRMGYEKVLDFGGINDWPYEIVR
jgi:phage shock protein E